MVATASKQDRPVAGLVLGDNLTIPVEQPSSCLLNIWFNFQNVNDFFLHVSHGSLWMHSLKYSPKQGCFQIPFVLLPSLHSCPSFQVTPPSGHYQQ